MLASLKPFCTRAPLSMPGAVRCRHYSDVHRFAGRVDVVLSKPHASEALVDAIDRIQSELEAPREDPVKVCMNQDEGLDHSIRRCRRPMGSRMLYGRLPPLA